MKVGIDLTSLLYHRGVSRYTFNLYRALSEFETVRLYPYLSVGRRARPALMTEWQRLRENLRPEAAAQLTANSRWQNNPPTLNHWLWHYLHLNPIKKVMPEAEVFHSWDYVQPPDKNVALVSTIHDLAMLKYPRLASGQVWRCHHESWRILRERGAHIIAVSEATRRDVMTYLDFPADHVHRVYEALPEESLIPPEKLTTQGWQMLASVFQLTRPFVLFVGTREPRKNLPHLIEAWQPLASEVDLVIVGAQGGDETGRQQQEHLHILEHVDDEQLAYLYTRAAALAYPSLDEGFGLPILEAFAYGTSVVTSNSGAMAEVAGTAAVLVEPLEVESIRAGLEQVLGEDKKQKQQRQKMMQARLAEFSWERTARETLQVYQLAIEEFYDR